MNKAGGEEDETHDELTSNSLFFSAVNNGGN
jgi:hypothetical protein